MIYRFKSNDATLDIKIYGDFLGTWREGGVCSVSDYAKEISL